MSLICICTIIPTLTVIGCMVTLYHAASLFTGVVTASILLITCMIYLAEIDRSNSHNNKCLGNSIVEAVVFIVLCLIIVLVCFGLDYGYTTTYCMFKECCTESWIAPNITGLAVLLREKVFGQHIATNAIPKLLKGHLETVPQKPLVLSLHGLSGTGKSYVTKMVVENMYVKGTYSRYVHYISVPNDVDPENYKDEIKARIKNAVHECPRSFFIFDNIEKMPHGLLDTLHEFFDFKEHVNGVDYRQTIFFLLSTTGGNEITRYIQVRKDVDRKQLSFKELEAVVSTAAYNEPNGLLESSLVSSNLISTYVPFLPLEQKHVKQCVAEEMFARDLYKFEHQVDKDDVETIADELEFFPEDTKRFSKSGCKRVSEKVKLFVRDE